MSAEEPLTLKPVVDFNSYLRTAFADGSCRCHRCVEGNGDESSYSHQHSFEFDGRQAHRRFANTAGSDVLQVLKKAWLSYTKTDMKLTGELDLNCVKGFTDAALHPRLVVLLAASGLAREVDGIWQLQAQAD